MTTINLKELTAQQFKGLGELLSDKRVLKLLNKYEIADYGGDFLPIGMNTSSGYICFAIDALVTPCFDTLNNEVILTYESSEDRTLCTSLEEVSEYSAALAIDNPGAYEELEHELKQAREDFRAWERD